MLRDYKVLDFTKIRSGISLLYILKILIKTPYSLPLAPPTYINTIYILIYLNLINIRTLKRPKNIRLPLKTLPKILILLLTGSTDVLSFLRRIYL